MPYNNKIRNKNMYTKEQIDDLEYSEWINDYRRKIEDNIPMYDDTL